MTFLRGVACPLVLVASLAINVAVLSSKTLVVGGHLVQSQ
jgi:hypothetical protein